MAILGAEDLALGFGPMGGDQFVLTIILADNVHELGKATVVDAVLVRPEDCQGDGAGRVELMDEVTLGREELESVFRAQFIADLITGAVDDDAGVVAVAEDGIARIGLPPLPEVAVVTLFGIWLTDGPAIERLVHDEKAHAVAEVEELGRGRIVGGADGVATDLLEAFEAAFPDAQGHSRTHSAAIVVEADTFDLHVLAIEVETGSGVEPKLADAERGHFIVDGSAVGTQLTDGAVEFGVL